MIQDIGIPWIWEIDRPRLVQATSTAGSSCRPAVGTLRRRRGLCSCPRRSRVSQAPKGQTNGATRARGRSFQGLLPCARPSHHFGRQYRTRFLPCAAKPATVLRRPFCLVDLVVDHDYAQLSVSEALQRVFHVFPLLYGCRGHLLIAQSLIRRTGLAKSISDHALLFFYLPGTAKGHF